MAHSRQARKRVRQNEKVRLRNRVRKSEMRTHMKRVLNAIRDRDREGALQHLAQAQKKIDKAAKRRVIHPNNAARKKSLLSRKVAELG